MSKTNRLYVFAVSHYCEKARWALEYHGIEHELRFLAPGLHFQVCQSLSLAETTVPILVNDQEVVQGSANIIDWAEQQSNPQNKLSVEGTQEIERRVDAIIGVHTRRFYYSDVLLNDPDAAKREFSFGLANAESNTFDEIWTLVRQGMIDAMDLGKVQREESREIIERELLWLDSLLDDGRPYLLGDRFTRADLAIAALTAPIVAPAESPITKHLTINTGWHGHRCLDWVREIYRQHRS